MPRKPHNLITDICGHLRICRKSASVRKCPDPCSGQTRRHSGTVQLRTDYCGQLREKYATVHTHVGNFFFFFGGGGLAPKLLMSAAYGNIQSMSLFLDKELNILIYETLFCVTICRSYELAKMFSLFGAPCI